MLRRCTRPFSVALVYRLSEAGLRLPYQPFNSRALPGLITSYLISVMVKSLSTSIRAADACLVPAHPTCSGKPWNRVPHPASCSYVCTMCFPCALCALYLNFRLGGGVPRALWDKDPDEGCVVVGQSHVRAQRCLTAFLPEHLGFCLGTGYRTGIRTPLWLLTYGMCSCIVAGPTGAVCWCVTGYHGSSKSLKLARVSFRSSTYLLLHLNGYMYISKRETGPIAEGT